MVPARGQRLFHKFYDGVGPLVPMQAVGAVAEGQVVGLLTDIGYGPSRQVVAQSIPYAWAATPPRTSHALALPTPPPLAGLPRARVGSCGEEWVGGGTVAADRGFLWGGMAIRGD